MKRRISRRKFLLIRPADGLLPLAFLAGDLFGPKILQGWLFAGWLAVRLCSLFSVDGVRMAYATQPGMRKVKGSTTLALILQCLGAAVVTGVYAQVFHGITPFTLAIIGIGLLLNIEHVFYEYLNAEGDNYSATLCGILSAVFLLAGVMLEPGGIPVVTLALSGIACLISALVAIISGGFRPYRPNSGVLRHGLRAMIYGMAYPLVIAAAIFGVKTLAGDFFAGPTDHDALWLETGLRTGFFAGLALTAVYRTPFRRSGFECREMWPVLAGVAVLCVAACAVCGLTGAIPGFVFYGVCSFSLCLIAAVAVILALWANFKKPE